jgi:beta-glucosidase
LEEKDMTRIRTLVTAGIALSLLAPLAVLAQGTTPEAAKAEKTPVYLDPARPIDERVDDLVGRMTLEEKVSQMTNSMQAIPRLQVPAYNVWSEALHGVAREGIATVFPEPIGMAATFDAPLLHQTATVTGLEGRVKFNEELRRGQRGRRAWGLTFFAPNVNIFRDPRWGRGQETYGEDPYLSSRMAVAFVTGLQGDDPDHLTAAATAKHYVVHSGPEPLRHQFDAVVSKHDLEDTYLPAFRAAVVEGKVQAVMCAYNAVNGVPACASEPLLEETLRKAWSFGGFVTGDCDAVDDIHAHHKYVKTAAEAAAVAVKAGTDNDCVVAFGPQGVPSKQKKYLEAVQQGLLSEADLTQAVKRVMRDRFELGLFDPPESVNPAHTPDAFLDSFANRELAARVARESMVLLKNDGVLPLPVDLKKIAVVGPLADSSRVLLGNYNGTPSRSTTALAGIEAQFPEARITFEPGTSFLRPLVPVPASALSTADGAPGLTAEVFESFDFTGSPLETRVDPGVQFGLEPGTFPDFGNPPPPPKPTRWTGFLTAPETGTYTLGVEGFGNRLFLDGKKLVDTSGGFPPPPNHVDIELEKGKRYAIKVEALPRFFASTRLSWLPADPNREQRAVDAARDADVVVAVVGITSDLEGEELRIDIPGFEGGDRTAIGLPEPELQLLKAVQATGKPLVVVLMSGSALAVNWSNQHANAIVEAWYPGEEGGTAIAEVLAGAYNPAGRLPITIYKGVEQLPPFTDYSMANRTYRYFDGQPLFPFGYGLSYSKFAYSNLSLSKATLAAGDSLEVAVDVKNTSDRAGDEVVQLYLTFPKLDGVPRHALRGFSRVHLRAGETRSVKLALADRDLSYVNADGTHMIGAGTYQLSVGGGQPGTSAPAATATFSIKGDRELPR